MAVSDGAKLSPLQSSPVTSETHADPQPNLFLLHTAGVAGIFRHMSLAMSQKTCLPDIDHIT